MALEDSEAANKVKLDDHHERLRNVEKAQNQFVKHDQYKKTLQTIDQLQRDL